MSVKILYLCSEEGRKAHLPSNYCQDCGEGIPEGRLFCPDCNNEDVDPILDDRD